MKYSGANWIENSLKCGPMSELGRNVADLLGELFHGIYHLDDGALRKIEWNNNHHIDLYLSWKIMSTADNDYLTRLVFLAHHMSLRVELRPCNMQGIKLMFHQRKRGSDGMRCHPTLDEAVGRFKQTVSLPENQERLLEHG
jgi:hypothetical protein